MAVKTKAYILITVYLLIIDVECLDSGFIDSSFNHRRPESIENMQATYNILIYNDNFPMQNLKRLGIRFFIPDNVISYNDKSHESVRMARIGQFDGQSTDSREPKDTETVGSFYSSELNHFSGQQDSKPDALKKSAQMLYELLKPYSSYSDLDFNTVYKQWFGH